MVCVCVLCPRMHECVRACMSSQWEPGASNLVMGVLCACASRPGCGHTHCWETIRMPLWSGSLVSRHYSHTGAGRNCCVVYIYVVPAATAVSYALYLPQLLCRMRCVMDSKPSMRASVGRLAIEHQRNICGCFVCLPACDALQAWSAVDMQPALSEGCRVAGGTGPATLGSSPIT